MAYKDYQHGDTSWFQQSRFGLFIHWGTYSLGARHEWLKNRERITDEEYMKYFNHFAPDLYDPKDWARMAREAGMKYFVITTKHHEGFCLWDSKHTDYKATNTPCGKDLLKPMVEAFRAEGLKVGFYYSLIDWHHPEFPVDNKHPQRDDQEFREKTKDRDVKKYAEYMYNQVEELLTDYHPDILWFDFSYPGEDGKGHEDWQSEKLLKMIRKHCPDIILDDRLDLPGSGDILTPEQFQPIFPPVDEDGKPVVWEACQTFSGSWGYFRDEMTWRDEGELIRTLIDCVSKDGNLLMNVGPTGRGEFDARAKSRLDAYAKWMHANGRSIYGCGAAPEDFEQPDGCKLTYNPETKRLYIHILAWPYKHVHLFGKGVENVEYAQFLHDASEVGMGMNEWHAKQAGNLGDQPRLDLNIPQMKPDVEIPVIELFLK